MDFLDPKKKRAWRIRLLIGYVLVAIAIAIGTLILVFASYGYGLDRQTGAVIQNGLVFVANQPEPADVYIDGQLRHSSGSARLVLPAGQYQLELKRNGYRSWQRTFTLEGGSIERLTYPLLFPTKLSTTAVQTFAQQPALLTQSPDRRWLIVQQSSSLLNLNMFDLNNPAKAPVDLSLPANLLTTTHNDQHWAVIDWSSDNRHVLLQHIFADTSEFILLDRESPANSINLSQTLHTTANIKLHDKKFDQYYLYDPATTALSVATLKNLTPGALLSHVLAYEHYGSDFLVYVTADGAPAGRVLVKVLTGGQTYTIRELSAQPAYLLDVSRYSNHWYVAAGAVGEGRVYVYHEPVATLVSQPTKALVPISVLKVSAPTEVNFSPNSRFIDLENGTAFAVYDIETDRTLNYGIKVPLDGALPAQWIDGFHLTVISGGQTVVFDFDGTNLQTLTPTTIPNSAFFTPDYLFMYNLAPGVTPGQFALTRTSLKAQ